MVTHRRVSCFVGVIKLATVFVYIKDSGEYTLEANCIDSFLSVVDRLCLNFRVVNWKSQV